MNKINILGIDILNSNKKAILNEIERFLIDKKQHYIVTPNPEIILAARKDEELFYILNKADLAVPDGIGLKFAAMAMGRNLKRTTGADLVKDILEIAQKKKLKVAVLSWKKGLSSADKIKKTLAKIYPDLNFIAKAIDREWTMPYYKDINAFEPDILFVGLGAPYQEKFIYHKLQEIPCVKLAIGAGGSFDFLTCRTKRAPKLISTVGFEWLWRLFRHKGKNKRETQERIKRIYNAVVKFPWKFFKWRFILPFLYRLNVVCVLYKKKNNKIKILLVERKNHSGHWQLPQGGTDGEDIQTAGARELSEELNCYQFKPIAYFTNVHKYKFGDLIGKFSVLASLSTGYKGQKQGLFIAEFYGKDRDIKINFWEHSAWKWVDAENLINEVHPIRQEAVKKFQDKFRDCL